MNSKGSQLTCATFTLALVAPALIAGEFRLGLGGSESRDVESRTHGLGLAETRLEELRLESTQPIEIAALAPVPAAEAERLELGASQVVPLVEPGPIVAQAALAAAAQESAPAAPRKRSWLKRRWWVVVLGALAVGIAVQDDSPDAEDPAPDS